ncbi:MAG: DNA-binding domain-containing protein [Rhodospirillales bacterium]|nr:DNA-binding domain-containing protein [Rhodospirillales bacterium]
MTSLLELQRAMRATLLSGGEKSPPELLAGIIEGAVPAAARLGVYRNNVLGNLTGALRLTFPAVERLVGPAFFAAAAAHFIAAEPPAGADLYEYGATFPSFLETFAPARALAWLPDVARLEWAVNNALHAPVAPALDAAALAVVPEARHPDLRFVAHPSLSLLHLTYPARAIWEALLTADAQARESLLAAIDPAMPGSALAILHNSEGLTLLDLSEHAFALARALLSGQILAEALVDASPETAPALLGGFLTQGFFCGYRSADHPSPIASECTQ